MLHRSLESTRFRSTRHRMVELPSRADLIIAVELRFPGISICFSKIIEFEPSYPTMIGITFVFVFHNYCVSILRCRYFKILSSSLSVTFQSRGTATSVIVVVRFALPITTIPGLRSDITLSVRNSN